MWSPLSSALRDEIQRFHLVFTCEACAHFVPEEEVCDLLYPTEPHRQATFDNAREGDPVLFCKMFEAR
jgi:hypothetical protein